MPLDELKPSPYNPRRDLKPEDPEYQTIKKSLDKFGLVDPLVWNRRSGRLVGGHQRIKVLREAGKDTAHVSVVDLDDEDERALNLVLNRAAGAWDQELLAEALADLQNKDYDLSYTGFSEDEVAWYLRERAAPRTLSGTRRERHPGLSVWHAVITSDIFTAAHFDYLLSYGTSVSAKPQERSPGSRLFIDSGLLQMAKKEGVTFLDKQDVVTEYAVRWGADWIAMLDVPMFPALLEILGITREAAYEKHVRNAYTFSVQDLPARKVMILQGWDEGSFEQCAKDMREMIGPDDIVAIGGIRDESSNAPYVCALTAMVHDYFPDQELHLLGIAAPRTMAQAYKVGATSCDAATASMHMGHGSILIGEKGNRAVVWRDWSGIDVAMGGKVRAGIFAFNALVVEAAIWKAMLDEGVEVTETMLEGVGGEEG